MEIWKEIKGYEGRYLISNLGQIKSVEREIFNARGSYIKGEHIMRPTIAKTGYMVVTLCKNCNRTLHYVHRLIAEAFIPNPLNKKEVNHINSNKQDFSIENLEWTTTSENIKHAYVLGGRIGAHTGKYGKNHHRSRRIKMVNSNGDFAFYDGIRDAERLLGYKAGGIGQVLLGKSKTCRGNKWEYA